MALAVVDSTVNILAGTVSAAGMVADMVSTFSSEDKASM